MTKSDSPRRPFDRRPGESNAAFQAFAAYRDAGLDRSIEAVAESLSKSGSLCRRWSARHEWVARVAAWDVERDRIEQAARAKVASQVAAQWERRRLEAAEGNWGLAQRLGLRAEEILKTPLYEVKREEIDPETGRPLHLTLEPAKWTIATAAALLKLAVELQSVALAEALGSRDDFDPATASLEECRAYLMGQGIKLAAEKLATTG